VLVIVSVRETVSVSVLETVSVVNEIKVSVLERMDAVRVTTTSAGMVTVSTGPGTVMVVTSAPAHLQAEVYLSQEEHAVTA
jgi:NADPH-dependent glutamate synthase beta subunit-like oxidoreductase